MSAKNKKKKKNKKQTLTPEMRRKRNAARARLASFMGLIVLCAAVGVLIKTSSKTEIVLSVDSAEYECLSSEVEDIRIIDPDTGETVAPTVITEEEGTADISDEDMAAVAAVNPKLSDTYAIDMVIQSPYAIVYDVEADEVLYAKNAEEKCFPASTTKIMTSAVTLKNAAEDTVFTVGNELDKVNEGSSLAMLEKGNELDLSMIIDAMMLPSGNDAAYCAAANVGRILGEDEGLSSEQAIQNFVDEMNTTAKAIGCENTHFANPDGFHDDDHYTTVLDMLKIALYAENFDMLNESVQKTERGTTFLSGEQVYWQNSNKLIQEDSDYYYLYANGMKTGMTDEAGYCIVATANRFDHQVICLVFGSSSSEQRWSEAIALLDAAFVQIRTR